MIPRRILAEGAPSEVSCHGRAFADTRVPRPNAAIGDHWPNRALGASHQRLLRLALGEGAPLVVIGMVIAIPGVYAAGGLVRGLLIEVSPWDPLTLSAVAVGLMLVTTAACYVPARRVLRIDPAPLLRKE